MIVSTPQKLRVIPMEIIYSQNSPSATWEIQHNMECHPSVAVVDSAGTIVIGDVTYTDINNVKIEFASAFAGKAYLR